VLYGQPVATSVVCVFAVTQTVNMAIECPPDVATQKDSTVMMKTSDEIAATGVRVSKATMPNVSTETWLNGAHL
jgi:hypothetical protein